MRMIKTNKMFWMALAAALLWAALAVSARAGTVPAGGALEQLGARSGNRGLFDLAGALAAIVCKPSPTANFDSCFRLYNRSYAAADAANRCAALSSSFRFVDNPDFDACYSLYNQTYTSAEAADTCVRKTRQARFDANFKGCFRIYNKSYTAAEAADRCVELSPSFRFVNNPDFDVCYSAYYDSYTSAEAADACVRQLR